MSSGKALSLVKKRRLADDAVDTFEPLTADGNGYLYVTNNLPTVQANKDAYGLDVFGRRYCLSYVSFVYPAASGNINTELVDVIENAVGGSALVSPTVSVGNDHMGSLKSGQPGGAGATYTTASVATIKRVRWVPGIGSTARFAVKFDTPNLKTEQFVGLGSATDALLIGYSGFVGGSTSFRISRSSSVEAPNQTFPVEQADFNLDKLDGTGPSGIVLDPQKGNKFQIDYGGGFTNIVFSVQDLNNDTMVPFHVIRYLNSNTVPFSTNPNGIQLFAYTANFDQGTDPSEINLRIVGMSVFANSKIPTFGIFKGFDVEKAATPTDTPILGLRVASTYPVGIGELNFNTITLRSVTFVKDTGSKSGILKIMRNPTTITGATWTAVDFKHNLMETDVTATAITGGDAIYILVTPSTGVSEKILDFEMRPGDVYILMFTTTGSSSDVTVAVNWVCNF